MTWARLVVKVKAVRYAGQRRDDDGRRWAAERAPSHVSQRDKEIITVTQPECRFLVMLCRLLYSSVTKCESGITDHG
jgi:hypothetical protein